MKIDIIKCAFCGKLAIAANDERLTDHKCAGKWNVVETAHAEEAEAADLREALEEAINRWDIADRDDDASPRIAELRARFKLGDGR